MNAVFAWKKPASGYEWESCESVDILRQAERGYSPPEGPYLVEKDYSQEVIPYHPLEDDALFAKFADLNSDADSFAKWASEHGMLIGGERYGLGPLFVLPENSRNPMKPIHYSQLAHGPGSKAGGYLQETESFGLWEAAHIALSGAVLLWELAMEKDIDSLQKLIRWRNNGNMLEIVHIRRDMFESVDFDRLWNAVHYDAKHRVYFTSLLRDGRSPDIDLFRLPEVIRPALYAAQSAVNSKLEEYPVNIILRMDPQGKPCKMLKPSSLLAAMWYQLSLALTGEIKLRRCSICGKWESMRNHRNNWKKHAICASNKRVEQFRKKHA